VANTNSQGRLLLREAASQMSPTTAGKLASVARNVFSESRIEKLMLGLYEIVAARRALR
jgi:hypothetical protein